MLNPEFIKRTEALLKDEYEAFESSLETHPPVSIRLNPKKSVPQIFKFSNPVPWCSTGFYLPERPSFTFDPLFHAGTYYVQEASSMFLEQVVRQITADGEPAVCLDLCAAPGGKSTHLISLLPDDSLLVSNEVIRSRCMILDENMAKWGYPNRIVTNSDPKDFGKLKHFFDVIVADLPCSGEGMFRKDRAGRQEWSPANVELCAARQRRIVHDVWEALKPGGYLVYSTCTFNTEENEDNIVCLAGEYDAEIIEIQTLPEWNIAGAMKHDIPVCRFFPHKTVGEGFFIAVLRKKEGDFTRQKSGFAPFSKNSYRIFNDCLKVVSSGVHSGEWKGKDFIPSAALALSTTVKREDFLNTELSYNEAIKYLQNEMIVLPADVPKGFVLVCYKNIPLGFVKNIGNRANNLYPKEWRIRKK